MVSMYEQREAERRAALKMKDAPDWRLMDTVEEQPTASQMSPQERSRWLDEQATTLRQLGKSYSQIGKRLDMPKSSAHKRVKRCRRKLREEFKEHEADLRDDCIYALKQGIGQMIVLCSQGDKTAFKLVMQYVNTRLRLSKIADPSELNELEELALNAAIEQEEAAWQKQQEERSAQLQREYELSRQAIDAQFDQAEAAVAAQAEAAYTEPSTESSVHGTSPSSAEVTASEEDVCGPHEEVETSLTLRADEASLTLRVGGSEHQPDPCGRIRGRKCGRLEQPVVATGFASRDVFDGDALLRVTNPADVTVKKIILAPPIRTGEDEGSNDAQPPNGVNSRFPNSVQTSPVSAEPGPAG